MDSTLNTTAQELLEADPFAEENPFEDIIAEDEKVNMEENESNSAQSDENEKKKESAEAFSFDESASSPEQKISQALDFMEKALSQPGLPHFKEFWEARKLCLDLFKENIPPSPRAFLWGKYCELSKEARRLKEILDEQTAFAVEQIEIAVKALEEEIQNEEEALSRAPTVHFEPIPQFFEKRLDKYIKTQLRLGLLNAHAARINVLRKELIKTEMRIRQKNKFFQRLSVAGDKVFPIRKELIKENSARFIEDVNAFIQEYFPAKAPEGDIFFLRDEIKSLQSIAKQLTLNTHAFTHSRQSLSECWDKLKEIEKERKKVRNQQKAVHKQNQDVIEAEIKDALDKFTAEQISFEEARTLQEELNEKIRRAELGRDEVRYLRDALAKLRQPLEEKEKAAMNARAQEEQLRQAQRSEKIQAIRDKLQQTILELEQKSVEELTADLQKINEETEALHISRNERTQLDRYFRELKEKISTKKDQMIFALAENSEAGADIAAMQSDLKKLLEHRRQIKETVDNLRKQSGSSGFDITKAMELGQQVHVENERLDKANAAIADLERKLKRLKKG